MQDSTTNRQAQSGSTLTGEIQKTRSKFRVHSKRDQGQNTIISLSPVYSSDPSSENYNFWSATPNGEIHLVISNPEGAKVFEENREYYVDFTPAPLNQ